MSIVAQRAMCKDQDPVLGSMLPHPGILDLLISTKIHFNFDELWVQKRKDLFFFFLVSGCTFAALKFFYIFILHADESVQIYITKLLWVVETVSP